MPWPQQAQVRPLLKTPRAAGNGVSLLAPTGQHFYNDVVMSFGAKLQAAALLG